MATGYYPLYVTDDNRVPALLQGSGSEESFTATGQTVVFGATGGFVDSSGLDQRTRQPAFRIEQFTQRQTWLVSGDNFTDCDVLLRFRQLTNTNTVTPGIILRTTKHASGALNGYLLQAGSGANYRQLQFLRMTGTSRQTFAGIDTQRNFTTTQTDPTSLYRYLRLKASGTTINIYGWFEGDDAIAIAKTHSFTDSNYSSGGIGIWYSDIGVHELDFISYGTGTDNAPLTARLTEGGGIVQDPRNPVTNVFEPSFNRPVRAYDKASGALLGYTTSSSVDGSFRVAGMRHGQRDTVFNALDTDGDNNRYGHAINEGHPTLQLEVFMADFFRFFQYADGNSGTEQNEVKLTNGEDTVGDYQATNFRRSELVISGKAAVNEMRLTFSIDNEFASNRLINSHEPRYWVEVFSDPSGSAFWRGKMRSANPTQTTITLTFVSLLGSLRRYGLDHHFQRTCRHALYDNGCTVPRETQHSQEVTVGNIDTRLNQVVITASGWDVRQSINGVLQQADRHYFVLAAGEFDGVKYLKLQNRIKLEAGAATLWRGCDKRLQTCKEVFNNSVNFGGFVELPDAELWGEDLSRFAATEQQP